MAERFGQENSSRKSIRGIITSLTGVSLDVFGDPVSVGEQRIREKRRMEAEVDRAIADIAISEALGEATETPAAVQAAPQEMPPVRPDFLEG